jgi:hypothetical protein
MTPVRVAVAAAGLAAALAACGGGAPGTAGSPSPAGVVVSPPLEPTDDLPVDLPDAELLFSCGDEIAFGTTALFEPPGAELAPSAPAAALRAFLAQPGVEVDALPDAGWRLVADEPDAVLFIAGDPRQDGALHRVVVERSAEGWRVSGWGGCRPFVMLGDGLVAAQWAFDPAAARPGPGSTTITALVTERSCSSGRPADGRIAPPFISYGNEAILVVFGVRPLPGNQDCPGAPPSRVAFELREPLGNRRLLDGAFFPPRDPADPDQD